VDIASASGTEEPGSNPAREIMAMLLGMVVLRNVHSLRVGLRNKGIGHKEMF
jgi:hypothetical protein